MIITWISFTLGCSIPDALCFIIAISLICFWNTGVFNAILAIPETVGVSSTCS